ncbi:hypothetical protein PM082_021266 [Marasmius tenuissimus]|nr:hypothetical protein PM082_021266 [Marasmius tenuissimus]
MAGPPIYYAMNALCSTFNAADVLQYRWNVSDVLSSPTVCFWGHAIHEEDLNVDWCSNGFHPFLAQIMTPSNTGIIGSEDKRRIPISNFNPWLRNLRMGEGQPE